MTDYNYDDSGAAFNFFLLTLLAFLLVPYTLNRKKDKNSIEYPGYNIKRNLKKKEYNFTRYLILGIGWGIFAVVVFRATTMEIQEETQWNPWEILGVNEGIEKSGIKKAFRALSLKFHPDKVSSEEKEEAEKKFVDISKAYKILTDEEAKKKFDETGNPDGTETYKLGLALPKWLVEKDNNMLVLFLYALIFGLGLPFAVSRWWSQATQLNLNKILNSTMAVFYRDLKENSVFRAVLETLTKADEFSTLITVEETDAEELDKLVLEIHKALDGKTFERFDRKKNISKLQDKVCILLVAYLARVTPSSEKLREEQALVAVESAKLVNGLLQIAVSRSWLNMAFMILDLSQMIYQAQYYKQSPIYQLPYIDAEILKHFDTKKRKISTIKEYLALAEAEQSSLLRSLSSEKFQILNTVAKKYPLLKINKAKFAVIGEPIIIPNALVTLIVELKLLEEYEPDTILDTSDSNGTNEEDEPINKEWWASNRTSKLAHTPYFPEDKRGTWWVILCDEKSNRIIAANNVRGLVDSKKVFIKFAAPPDKGTWKFQVVVKSDFCIGCDLKTNISLVVHPMEAAPPIDDDDDISEPDEDTLAGQMEAVRRQKAGAAKEKPKKKDKKPTNKKYQDAEDSTDSEADEAHPVGDGGGCCGSDSDDGHSH